MNLRAYLLIAGFLVVDFAAADEPLDIAGEYKQTVADYQRIVAATENTAARAAAGRLTRKAYRNLIEKAQGAETSSADDLHALGQCHEAIGENDQAQELYTNSLKASPAALHLYQEQSSESIRRENAKGKRHRSNAEKTAMWDAALQDARELGGTVESSARQADTLQAALDQEEDREQNDEAEHEAPESRRVVAGVTGFGHLSAPSDSNDGLGLATKRREETRKLIGHLT